MIPLICIASFSATFAILTALRCNRVEKENLVLITNNYGLIMQVAEMEKRIEALKSMNPYLSQYDRENL